MEKIFKKQILGLQDLHITSHISSKSQLEPKSVDQIWKDPIVLIHFKTADTDNYTVRLFFLSIIIRESIKSHPSI